MHYVVRPSLAAVDARDGCPHDVILIHGLMSSTSEWTKNIDALATRHRVWAIDLIGFGFSSRMTTPAYSLRYYAESVLEFLDAHRIARASIVGHSLGGGIALQFAHDHGDRVDRLILIGPEAYISGLIKTAQVVTRIPSVRARSAAPCCAIRGAPRALCNALARRTGWTKKCSPPGPRNGTGHRNAGCAFCHARFAPRVRYAGRIGRDHDAGLDPVGRTGCGAPALARPAVSTHAGERGTGRPARGGHVPNEEFPEIVNRLMLDFLDKDDADR